ncbi:MAG: AAA family ATPase, partial [Bacteroidales bacterium]|nr:AAA family ATPase [Bacteroidales bacterium]
MIIEFKVKNYLSFKEEQIVSFEASQDKYMQDYHCIDLPNGERLLRMGMVYGSNASGKTNMLLALNFLKEICTQSLDREQKTGFVPFEFDSETRKSPGFFEITLYLNNIKYIYNVLLDEKIIYSEKLYFYPGTQPALVFQRQYNPKTNDYSLKSGSRVNIDSIELSVLKSNTLNNMTIIAGFKKTNIHFPELQSVYQWFEHGIEPIIRPWNNLYRNVIDKIENQEEGFKAFVLENLEIADFKIKSIDVELEDTMNELNNTDYGMGVQENYARYFK